MDPNRWRIRVAYFSRLTARGPQPPLGPQTALSDTRIRTAVGLRGPTAVQAMRLARSLTPP